MATVKKPDISYTESLGHTPIGWKKVFLKYLKADKINNEDFHEQLGLLGSWDSCPVSELSATLARNALGEPTDSILCLLGNEFQDSFKAEKFQECLDLLELIELRAKQIIAGKAKDKVQRIKQLERSWPNFAKKFEDVTTAWFNG